MPAGSRNPYGRPMDGARRDLADLATETARLVTRLRGVSLGWYAARAGGSTRADVVRHLAGVLADLGRDAGGGAPAGAAPPVLGVYALPDQIAVLAQELLGAPRAARTARVALDAVRASRAQLG